MTPFFWQTLLVPGLSEENVNDGPCTARKSRFLMEHLELLNKKAWMKKIYPKQPTKVVFLSDTGTVLREKVGFSWICKGSAKCVNVWTLVEVQLLKPVQQQLHIRQLQNDTIISQTIWCESTHQRVDSQWSSACKALRSATCAKSGSFLLHQERAL